MSAKMIDVFEVEPALTFDCDSTVFKDWQAALDYARDVLEHRVDAFEDHGDEVTLKIKFLKMTEDEFNQICNEDDSDKEPRK